MTPTDLGHRIAADTGMAPGEVDAVLASLARQVQECLAAGERVQLPGLMTCEPTDRAERTGRNPRTGEPITIPARRAVRLIPAAALKRAVRA